LAEFRDVYDDFRGLGIQIAALSVDSPEQSERVRRQYELPFPILCDTQKEVVRAWGLFNAEEKGGIAVPAIVLVGRDRRIRLMMVEGVATRVRAADLLEFLRAHPVPANTADDVLANSAEDAPSNTPRQRAIFPSLVDVGRAIGNSLTRARKL
jgi:alkyl hydroperoxide reductase subunit AhpC